MSRTVKGEAAKDIRIGVYINVGADCKSGPLPTVRVVSHPKDGKVTLKKGRISATNYKQCLAMQVPGYVVFYRSRPEFSGTDALILEVAFPDGRIEKQNIKVMVEGQIPTRGI